MSSLRLQLYSFFSRMFFKPRVAGAKDPQMVRDSFERHAKRMHFAPPSSVYRNGTLAGVPCLWVSRKALKSEDVLFYIHGGGFICGSPDTHKHMVAYLAGRLGLEAVMPRYRLAPEHPFPAGFDDIVTAYKGLLQRGLRADQIVLGGDSAGGALALALLAYLSDQGMEQPQSAFVLSPVVNLRYNFDSIKGNAKSDCLFPAHRSHELAEMYLGDHARTLPYASPYYADFKRCPPILFHCCEGEILRDDTLEMQSKLVALGHDVLVRSWPNAFHVFHIMLGHFPEAKAALDDIVSFVKAQRSQDDS